MRSITFTVNAAQDTNTMASATLFLVILAFCGAVVATGINQCRCYGYVSSSWNGPKQWFYTYSATFGANCNGYDNSCENNCKNYLNTIYGNGYHLTTSYNGMSLGEWICRQVKGNLPANSFVYFKSQSCNREPNVFKTLSNLRCDGDKYIP